MGYGAARLTHPTVSEMMYALPLPRHRRANVWLDEAPPADFVASSVLTRLVKPKNVVDASRRIAAVEMMIPYGPMPAYALLGGELAGADVDGLEVTVSVNPIGVPFAPSLAVSSDEAYVGLPDEYVGGVFSGIEKLTDSIGLPAKATLRFRWAAHGLVGSSSSMFEKVSGLVVRLLALPKDAGEKEIMALFG